jgi:hypothetical protein
MGFERVHSEGLIEHLDFIGKVSSNGLNGGRMNADRLE